MRIELTFAKPGNGKTLDTTRTALGLLQQYAITERKYPNLPKRCLWANMKFSKKIENIYLGTKLHYWTTPSQLYGLRDVDIIIDDIAIYLPNDEWTNVPKKMKKLFVMYRHRGLRIFANCQDYKMVAIQFRRMVKFAYKINKIVGSRDKSATLPPLRPKWWMWNATVWGIVIKRSFDPDDLNAQANSIADTTKLKTSLMPHSIFFITRFLVSAYDTTEELDPMDSCEYDHETWYCKHPGCEFEKTFHTKRI